MVRHAPVREEEEVVEEAEDGAAGLVDGGDDGVARGGERLEGLGHGLGLREGAGADVHPRERWRP